MSACYTSGLNTSVRSSEAAFTCRLNTSVKQNQADDMVLKKDYQGRLIMIHCCCIIMFIIECSFRMTF